MTTRVSRGVHVRTCAYYAGMGVMILKLDYIPSFTLTRLREMSKEDKEQKAAPPTMIKNTAATALVYASMTGSLMPVGRVKTTETLSRTAAATSGGRDG